MRTTRDPAPYYTYGAMPEQVWPLRHEAPLPAHLQAQEESLLGATEGFAFGGMAGEEDLGALSALLAGATGGGEEQMAAPPPDSYVQGAGNGREDSIEARLSPGEYVFDAETVALLGDGNNEAGARLLDQLREEIRRHKGQALAEGEISPDARAPLEYLMEE